MNIEIENWKSAVRISVTYLAAIYTFIGSGILIGILLFGGEGSANNFEDAKDLFMLVLPVATGVITYWFASRPKSEENPSN